MDHKVAHCQKEKIPGMQRVMRGDETRKSQAALSSSDESNPGGKNLGPRAFPCLGTSNTKEEKPTEKVL